MPKQRFPDWIVPMAATLTQERFADPEWSFERKFDGIRLIAYKKGKQVELFSRNRLPQNIPAISRAIAKLPHRELILDGEIDWHAVGTHASSRAAYHIFDIMWIDGHETMSLPLEERRALLKQLPLTAPLKRVTELPAMKSVTGAVATGSADKGGSHGISPTVRQRASVSRPVGIATGSADNLAGYHDSPWDYAREKRWEGVIAKRRGSIYEPRRSPNWLKMKVEMSQEFVVGGFTDPQGKRVGLGALLVGYYEKSEPPASAGGYTRRNRGSSPTVSAKADFIFAGKIGTGFNNELLLDLRRKLDGLEIAKPPFTKAVGLPRLRAHWVHPKIVVQVGFIQWTNHNKLRHPRLLGVRHDKDPRDVVRE
jgi:ATP-dependent DNA ligase